MASPSNLNRTRTTQGFTLIEVLVVLGMVAMLGGLSLYFGLSNYRSYSFNGERDLIVTALQRARAQAINNVCQGVCDDGKPHGVHLEAGTYTIFQGTTYTAGDPYNEVISSGNASFVLGGINDVVFEQLSGDAAPAGDITLQDDTGHISTITVGAEGQILWTH